MKLPFIEDLRRSPGSKYEDLGEASYKSHLPQKVSSIHKQHSVCR